MATVTGERVAAPVAGSPAAGAAAARGVADWVLAALCTWVVAGAYLDVWAHSHRALLESFLTPWHAVLYSGMLTTSAYLMLLRRHRRAAGLPWDWRSGYGLSLTGCALFALSGAADAAWHTLFGIETGLNGLISPPHVMLTASAGLIVSGPLRVAWSAPGRRASWPAVVSAALVLSSLTFLTQFDHPLSNLWSAGAGPPAALGLRGDSLQLGLLGILLQTGLLASVVLLLVSRFRLPFGALTAIVGINGLLVTAVDGVSVMTLVAVAMGAAGDLLLRALDPSPARPARLRLFAAIWPGAVYVVYFVELLARSGVWWPLHVWTGSVLIAAAEGWLISYLIVPEGRAVRADRG